MAGARSPLHLFTSSCTCAHKESILVLAEVAAEMDDEAYEGEDAMMTGKDEEDEGEIKMEEGEAKRGDGKNDVESDSEERGKPRRREVQSVSFLASRALSIAEYRLVVMPGPQTYLYQSERQERIAFDTPLTPPCRPLAGRAQNTMV